MSRADLARWQAIALAHAAVGRHVFPLGGLDGKKPIGHWKSGDTQPGWDEGATTDPARIERMFKGRNVRGVGWALPAGLVVVDVDDPAAFDAVFGTLPDAPGQDTTRGYHRLYRADTDAVRQGRIPGGDLKVGDKGYVRLMAEDAFTGTPPDLPEALIAARLQVVVDSAEGTDEDPMTSRNEILGLAGRLREAGAGTQAIEHELLKRLEAGLIADADEGNPWTPADMRQIAGAAPVGPPVRLPRIRRIRRADSSSPRPVTAGPLSRPLADVDGSLPEPLVDGKLHPTAATILYGTGGTGKGVVAAHWIARRTMAGEVVMILDYECHPDEWRRRIEQAGGRLDLVHIATPLGSEGGALVAPIWSQAADIRADADRLNASWLLIDSVMPAAAVGGDGAMSDPGIPSRYFQALMAIDRPSLSLGHVTKADRDLAYPFGSVYWHNFARMTWSLEAPTPDRRTLTNRKTNVYPNAGTVDIEWGWSETMAPGQTPSVLVETTTRAPSNADRAYRAIGNDTLRTAELLARVNADGGPLITRASTLTNKIGSDARFKQVKRGVWKSAVPRLRGRDTGEAA